MGRSVAVGRGAAEGASFGLGGRDTAVAYRRRRRADAWPPRLRIKKVNDEAQDFRMQLAQQAIDFRSEPPMEGHCQWQHDPGPAERLNLQNDTGSSYLQVEKDRKAFSNSLYKI